MSGAHQHQLPCQPCQRAPALRGPSQCGAWVHHTMLAYGKPSQDHLRKQSTQQSEEKIHPNNASVVTSKGCTTRRQGQGGMRGLAPSNRHEAASLIQITPTQIQKGMKLHHVFKATSHERDSMARSHRQMVSLGREGCHGCLRKAAVRARIRKAENLRYSFCFCCFLSFLFVLQTFPTF